MTEEFPSNNQTQKSSKPEERQKLEPVVKSAPVEVGKTRWEKFKDSFLKGQDARTVISGVWRDVLLPAAQDMIVSAIQEGAERSVYGEGRGSGKRRGTSSAFGGAVQNAYTSYRSIGSSNSRQPETRRDTTERSRATHDFRDLLFNSRSEAIDVLDNMFSILDQFEQVTVMDFYDLAGYTSKFTDENYGWTDLRGSQPRRRPDGYVIDLPRPVPLNRR